MRSTNLDERRSPGPQGLPGPTRLGVLVAVVGTCVGLATAFASPFEPTPVALLFIGLTIAAGLVFVPLPAHGVLSLSYPFVLATMMAFGIGASVVAALLAALTAWRSPTSPLAAPSFARIGFHVGVAGLAASCAGGVYQMLGGPVGSVDPVRALGPIASYTATYAAIHLSFNILATRFSRGADSSLLRRFDVRWSVLGFVTGSSLATLLAMMVQHRQLVFLSLAAPFLYLGHLAHRARVRHAEDESRHSQQTTDLYRSVTEAMAMAIEAKDECTEEHLRRVQHLSLELGSRLGLSKPQMEALGVASLLHDIGKIAVPEYILTKPGRLTPEEEERIRLHPGVGAEILGRVPFPYPLAPIVRHHHERWDGNGYPDRLRGEAIPLGARILSVVDCYDALTSDRPYRGALSREETLDYLRGEAGAMFDPMIVETLIAHVDDIEDAARSASSAAGRTGPEEQRPVDSPPSDIPDEGVGRRRVDVFGQILRAQREMQAMYDIARTVGRGLALDDSFVLLSAKLAKLVPFRSLVVYLFDEDRTRLVARFAVGDGSERLRRHSVPIGERLAGWAARHQRAFIGQAHATPLERDGARSDLEDLMDVPEIAGLRSSLVAPLTTDARPLGVIALYHDSAHPYDAENRRVLQVVAGHLAQTIHNAASADERPESLTDPLTGIPNGRFFFLEADYRFSRANDDAEAAGIVGVRIDSLDELSAAYGPTAATRALGLTARRLASACGPGETLIRFAGNVFLVLTGHGSQGALVRRGHELALVLRSSPVEVRLGTWWNVPVRTAHAAFPADGQGAEQLLDALEERLEASPADSGKILPFPHTGRHARGLTSSRT